MPPRTYQRALTRMKRGAQARTMSERMSFVTFSWNAAIQFQIPEFTCHCPLTGQPDFAHITIDMVADALCVELKSLKMYMWSYRDAGAFHEKVTNDILADIVRACAPRFIRVSARWFVRGGIYTNVVAEQRKKGWKPAPRVELPAHAEQTGLL